MRTKLTDSNPSEFLQSEIRNVVAGIPISKQVRLGGVGLHVEQFSV